MPFSNQATLSRFLARLLLRSQLCTEEQHAILKLNGHAVQVAARQEIVGQGQTVSRACLIASGLVARFDQMSDGRRQITAFHFPGDMCDLHSVPCPTAGWGLSAVSASTVLHVPHGELLAIALQYPAVALAFWRDTIADGSVLAKWVGNVGRKDARAGMAHLFCEIGLRCEQAGIGTREHFRLEATQEQLGDALGITPVHVNRVLKVLRSAGIVSLEAHEVRVRDWNELAAIGDFDPAYMLINPLASRAAA